MDNKSDKIEVTKGWSHAETLWGIVLQALEMLQLTKALDKEFFIWLWALCSASGAWWKFYLDCGTASRGEWLILWLTFTIWFHHLFIAWLRWSCWIFVQIQTHLHKMRLVQNGAYNSIYRRIKRIQGKSISQLLRTLTRYSISISYIITNLSFLLAAWKIIFWTYFLSFW